MADESQKTREPDWEAELARQHSCEERFDKLAVRVDKLERKARWIEGVSDERLYLYLFAAYVFFAFIVPAFTGTQGEK